MSPQSQILRDASSHPRLFHWFGEMSPEEMDAWLQASGLEEGAVPSDLRALWEARGGGNYFESETLLGPRGDRALGDEVLATNRRLWDQGLPRHYLVFSWGVFTGAVDTRTGEYVLPHEEGWKASAGFTTLEAWYAGTVRRNFAWAFGSLAEVEDVSPPGENPPVVDDLEGWAHPDRAPYRAGSNLLIEKLRADGILTEEEAEQARWKPIYPIPLAIDCLGCLAVVAGLVVAIVLLVRGCG